MAITAPMPEQPSAAEMTQWTTNRSNARATYENNVLRNQYGRNQADIGYQANLRNLTTTQGQNRRNFDESYINRGMFNSGVRQQGLSDFLSGNVNQLGDLQQQYMGQVGQYDIEDTIGMQDRDRVIRNVDAAEQARRTDLASQIRGIV